MRGIFIRTIANKDVKRRSQGRLRWTEGGCGSATFGLETRWSCTMKACMGLLVFLILLPAPCAAVREEKLPAVMDASILPFYQSQLESGVFRGRGGVPISYVRFAVPAEKGALVVSTGRTESHIKYAEFIYDLRGAGFSIYVLDHRGQGFSGRMLDDPQKGHVQSFEDYVADLKTFIDTVVNGSDHPKRFMLAHSMGGAVAALYAARYGRGLDGLILSAPMMQIDTRPLPKIVASWMAGALTALGMGDAYVPGGGAYDPGEPFLGNKLTHSEKRYAVNRMLISRHPRIALGSPTIRWLREALDASRRARDAAEKIRIPVLLLQAENDRVVRPAGQDEFCRRASDCARVMLPGARHEILMERDEIRDRAIERILRFLREHTAAH